MVRYRRGAREIATERMSACEKTKREHDHSCSTASPERPMMHQSLIDVEHPFSLPIWKPAAVQKVAQLPATQRPRYARGPLSRHLGHCTAPVHDWRLALTASSSPSYSAISPNSGRRYL
ncbi:hypothetical protein EXIGLDRAFT_85076 [Exidia glandulosa HHB12029]|uniref:Uncharacterized protein n=1 Tax=Exidia glandulosa HHB12029 TaxID=1314781 RepID=A0A165HGX7_EXIGL|nr:hypothetical protein EXIGLDRAFT_85076 [Exidia glandulosa HHB12029]